MFTRLPDNDLEWGSHVKKVSQEVNRYNNIWFHFENYAIFFFFFWAYDVKCYWVYGGMGD